MAIVLAPHSDAPIDTAASSRCLLVHDLVEIDVGDTFAYDDVGALTKTARRKRRLTASSRSSRRRRPRSCARSGTSSRRAPVPTHGSRTAIDRLAPMLLNYENGGALWREHALHGHELTPRSRTVGIADGIDRRSGPRSKAVSTMPNDRAGSNRD